jgi:hypothetical protein
VADRKRDIAAAVKARRARQREAPAAFVDDLPKDKSIIARAARSKFKDKADARADIERRYPGCKFGRYLPHLEFWVWQIQPKEMQTP